MDSSSPLLRIANLDVAFGPKRKPIVRGFSCEIQPGDILQLAGPNGSGKTTLLKAFAGLLNPEAKVEGVIQGQKGCIYVGEDLQCDFALTAYDVLELAELKRSIRGCAIQKAIDDFELNAGILGSNLSNLSHGQRQRVNLARAWIQGSTVLLLDESLSALDQATRQLVLQRIQERRERRLATVIVSHDPSLAEIANQKYIVAPNA